MNENEIKTKKIYEEITERIYKMIRTGQLNPGDKLDSVEQLAAKFNVGRSAVREALTALRAMGLVEMKQGEGTFIKDFDPKRISLPLSMAVLMNEEDILHLIEVRKIIETGTAAIAAKKRSSRDLEAMRLALEEMRKLQSGGMGEKADFRFHLAIAEASKNPLILGLLNDISELMKESMRETRKIWHQSKQKKMEDLHKDHENIFNAISNKNESEAVQAMTRHLENVETVLKEYLNEIKKK